MRNLKLRISNWLKVLKLSSLELALKSTLRLILLPTVTWLLVIKITLISTLWNGRVFRNPSPDGLEVLPVTPCWCIWLWSGLGRGKQRASVTNAGCPPRLFVELSLCWVPLSPSIPTPLQMEIAATFTDEKSNKRSPARKGELGQECRMPDSQAYLVTHGEGWRGHNYS